MAYRFDNDEFNKWFLSVARMPETMAFHRNSAAMVICNQFIQKQPPRYVLSSHGTLSGKQELYPPPFKFPNNVFNIK